MKPYTFHPIVKKALDPLSSQIPDDCIGVHGVIYKPDDFQKIHPGGSIWIEVCKGTDATALFETMHINNKLAKLHLKKIPAVGTYSVFKKWNFDSYRNLSDKMLSLFPTLHSRQAFRYKFAFWILLGSSLHIALLFQTQLNLNWFLIIVSSSIVNTILGGFGHNYLHKLDASCLALDWNGLSSFEWMLEHIISHHCNPNSEHDHDTISMLPFVDWQTPKFMNLLIFPLFAIGEIVVAVQGYLGHRCRWYPIWSSNFNEKTRYSYPFWIQFAPFLFIARVLSHFIFQPFVFASITIMGSLSIASFYFSYLAHLNHASQGKETLDFFKNQLDTTRDLKSKTTLLNDFLLGLDKQTLHHLFPAIDHSLLTQEIRTFVYEETKNKAFIQNSFIEMNQVMWKRLMG